MSTLSKYVIGLGSLLALLGCLAVGFFLSRGAAEGAFVDCKFSNKKEALPIAEREFSYVKNASGRLNEYTFVGEVIRVGKNADGHYSANILFQSNSTPAILREMFLMDDCTQAITEPQS